MVVSTPSSASQRTTACLLSVGRPEHALLSSHPAVAVDLVTEPWCDSILREPDPLDARRATHQLARAGRDLFPYVLALAQWGGTQTRQRDTIGWVHAECGHTVRGRMACSHCRQSLLPHEVVRPRWSGALMP
jgi:hypothetical protein